jgi:nucleotide-binding universal stress UspA family protein
MTVVVGVTPGERTPPHVTLGATLAMSSGKHLIVAAVTPEPWPPNPFRIDEEFLAYQAKEAEKALSDARAQVGDSIAADYLLQTARSVSSGLLGVADEHGATCIVLGSSSTGVLNRVAIGGIADRILHSSSVPVAVAPRGFPARPRSRLARVTVAFGRGDDDSDLLAAAARRAATIGARLRVACFAVHPPAAAAIPSSHPYAADLVASSWVDYLRPVITSTLQRTGGGTSGTSVDIAVGQGPSWSAALTDISWREDDILIVGTSASPLGRLFMGSHASKIVRHSPVPVFLVPRSAVDHPVGADRS